MILYTLFWVGIPPPTIEHAIGSRRPVQKNNKKNPTEVAIIKSKNRQYRILLKNKVTNRLWYYGLIWIFETGNISVSSLQYASGRTPLEYITGETPDISEYLDFNLYDWTTYRANDGLGELSIGLYLGVSNKVGQMIYYWVLTVSGIVTLCVTVQRLTNSERNTDEWSQQMRKYNIAIEQRIDVTDTDLSKELAMVELWNNTIVADEDTEFLGE